VGVGSGVDVGVGSGVPFGLCWLEVMPGMLMMREQAQLLSCGQPSLHSAQLPSRTKQPIALLWQHLAAVQFW